METMRKNRQRHVKKVDKGGAFMEMVESNGRCEWVINYFFFDKG